MMRKLPILILIIVAAACGEPDDDIATNNPTNTANNTTGVNPQFGAVADILRPNCLLGGCHGEPAGLAEVYVVSAGTAATDREICTTLGSIIPAPSGRRLVKPLEPDESEIYVRITKTPGDPELMGAGSYGGVATPLSSTQIAAIESWITDGAECP